VAVSSAVPARHSRFACPGAWAKALWLRLNCCLSYEMGSAVNFEDIFAEAEDVLPPAFPKDHYVQANARVAAQQAHPSSQSTSTPSYLFTLSIATVVFIFVYWVYSFVTDLRRRQREAFFQL
jgi:hypothetical protein